MKLEIYDREVGIITKIIERIKLFLKERKGFISVNKKVPLSQIDDSEEEN